ncbi:beta-lactamase [Thiopseudomonas alkaliphila]|uniref:Beta-lactamase n=1 Tax=Thiopseudomonas alkaliphila TaxID=1697053 RepID=A0A0K1XBG3_9GAMM|nr:MBL fold metallo-hydrolase [Thiopseudomonas alkaliphila]AKX44015.1 beta-lactamase [Thiopseudomonas alkaliphila]AKX46252.1 beta-lactamase [Thiopseudomonas alkaliphila]AKX49322.1 beta-lactamase [Thiopseudomonas alkaliphila]AKX50074.1 beta-lactamase [Thiopseudomonas alkaliphila]AKX52769.1 beta-lactamase [Thiopseudomonas alkaliphila]
MSMQIKEFFHQDTSTYSYVVTDSKTKCCAIIDSVLDYDAASGRTATVAADELVAYVKQQGLTVEWLLETHVHADHLSAAPYLKQQLGGLLAIGEHILEVQEVFGKLFNAGTEFARDGRQFDRLFKDGDVFAIGQLKARVLHTPGHTPACVSYVIEDAVFVGDTLFMPDYGTARCDFPGGDAQTLYQSIQKLFALPDETRMYMCHDYKAPGREEYLFLTTVGDERQNNIHVHQGVSEQEFVTMRTERDAGLSMPRLILPSVQVNMRAGELPPEEDNGVSYLKIPLNAV